MQSFECQLPAPPCFPQAGASSEPYRALFIRAPAVLLPCQGVEVLGEYVLTPDERASQVRPLRSSGLCREGCTPGSTPQTPAITG